MPRPDRSPVPSHPSAQQQQQLQHQLQHQPPPRPATRTQRVLQQILRRRARHRTAVHVRQSAPTASQLQQQHQAVDGDQNRTGVRRETHRPDGRSTESGDSSSSSREAAAASTQTAASESSTGSTQTASVGQQPSAVVPVVSSRVRQRDINELFYSPGVILEQVQHQLAATSTEEESAASVPTLARASAQPPARTQRIPVMQSSLRQPTAYSATAGVTSFSSSGTLHQLSHGPGRHYPYISGGSPGLATTVQDQKQYSEQTWLALLEQKCVDRSAMNTLVLQHFVTIGAEDCARTFAEETGQELKESTLSSLSKRTQLKDAIMRQDVMMAIERCTVWWPGILETFSSSLRFRLQQLGVLAAIKKGDVLEAVTLSQQWLASTVATTMDKEEKDSLLNQLEQTMALLAFSGPSEVPTQFSFMLTDEYVEYVADFANSIVLVYEQEERGSSGYNGMAVAYDRPKDPNEQKSVSVSSDDAESTTSETGGDVTRPRRRSSASLSIDVKDGGQTKSTAIAESDDSPAKRTRSQTAARQDASGAGERDSGSVIDLSTQGASSSSRGQGRFRQGAVRSSKSPTSHMSYRQTRRAKAAPSTGAMSDSNCDLSACGGADVHGSSLHDLYSSTLSSMSHLEQLVRTTAAIHDIMSPEFVKLPSLGTCLRLDAPRMIDAD